MVSSETVEYGDPITPTFTQVLTVDDVQADADAFGLGINPASADIDLASFVTLDVSGDPAVGFYDDGLITSGEVLPYDGMSFMSTPGDRPSMRSPSHPLLPGPPARPWRTRTSVRGAFRSG